MSPVGLAHVMSRSPLEVSVIVSSYVGINGTHHTVAAPPHPVMNLGCSGGRGRVRQRPPPSQNQGWSCHHPRCRIDRVECGAVVTPAVVVAAVCCADEAVVATTITVAAATAAVTAVVAPVAAVTVAPKVAAVLGDDHGQCQAQKDHALWAV